MKHHIDGRGTSADRLYDRQCAATYIAEGKCRVARNKIKMYETIDHREAENGDRSITAPLTTTKNH